MGSQWPSDSGMSLQTFRRLPSYYNYLRELCTANVAYISAPTIAGEMGLNEVQVRKDLAAASRSPGKPRKGFAVAELMDSIGECLGYHNNEDAILVGVGKLGKALLAYKGFEEHGVRIIAAFDVEESIVGTSVAGKKVLPLDKLPSLCRRMGVRIGIITVPAPHAQVACDFLVESGMMAIWNFAPIHLHTPKDVLVQNENMAAHLALLSQQLSETLGKGGNLL